jgi:hypothetical protein
VQAVLEEVAQNLRTRRSIGTLRWTTARLGLETLAPLEPCPQSHGAIAHARAAGRVASPKTERSYAADEREHAAPARPLALAPRALTDGPSPRDATPLPRGDAARGR